MAATDSARVTGLVAHWQEARGMGFITPSLGGDDYYVHRSQLLDGLSLAVGMEVSFEASFDPQRGKPVAMKVQKTTSMVMSDGAQQTPLSGSQMGTVSSWQEQRGMGFICAGEGGQEFFVHRSQLLDGGSLVTGNQVSFEPSWDSKKGKPIAMRVTGAVSQLSPPGGPGKGMDAGYGMHMGCMGGKGAVGGMASKGSSPYGQTGGKGSAEPPPCDNLYIIGLPDGIDDNGLMSIFGPYGRISSCKILGSKNGNTAAMVRWASVGEATMIKDNLNGNIPQGLTNPITVRYAQSLPGGQQDGPETSFGAPVPAVVAAQLQDLMTRLKRDKAQLSQRRKTMLLIQFFALRMVFLFFGFEAFLVKFRGAAKHLSTASESLSSVVQIFLFLNQMLGVVQLNMYANDRLFSFVFGGVDNYIDETERRRMRIWKAAFQKRAWDTFGSSPARYFTVVLTFNDVDFQRLVLDEEA